MKKETIYKITSVLLLSFPLIAFAAISHPTGTTENIVGGIFTLLGSIAAIIAVVFIALGLFKFSTSGGDPRTMDEAKTSLIWGGVGIIVAVAMLNATTVLTWFGITFTD